MTTSELLKQAREYEKKRISEISPEERPTYHVTGGAGWINDPNIIFFISIILMPMNGDQCTGGMW